MKKNNALINPKKIPYYLLLAFLTSGAGLIIGFLSFSGLYVLAPILPLAFAAFGLSVAYEGEIYLQNIKGALKKLFKYHYVENHLAQEYLLDHVSHNALDTGPEFFRDYAKQSARLALFAGKSLNTKNALKKQVLEKSLKDMEKWFAQQLFVPNTKTKDLPSDYAKELTTWLANHEQSAWREQLNQRKKTFRALKFFSFFAGGFMTLGTTYLIVEAFSVIPYFMAIPFATWPLLIAPMALIAGTAYGLLTYNATTDFVNNSTINKWLDQFKHDWQQGVTLNNLVMSTSAFFLLAITVTLTICTAGTWWTVAGNARPLFQWLKKMPGFVMSVINPIITGLSAVCFNFQNTTESLELIHQALYDKQGLWQQTVDYISGGFITLSTINKSLQWFNPLRALLLPVFALQIVLIPFKALFFWGDLFRINMAKGIAFLRRSENSLQLANPFRIVLKLTIAPLRIIFFIGHLISIGVTADRMPGVSEIIAALVAIISEGFEDMHYFVGHEQEMDIPTIVIRTVAIPLYALAAIWDYFMSQYNANPLHVLSFNQAWNKQRGIEEEQDVTLDSSANEPSTAWKVEHTVYLIEKFQQKHLASVTVGQSLADKKTEALDALKQNIRTQPLENSLLEATNNPIFNQNRLFNQGNAKTNTQEFVENLARTVGLRP